ncbi:cupin domain-containing protein [Pseudomonas brassicacearum]|uniref:cupin domain-containing protein n=1 Tax=Pseudomonas brassicacearum TaxID=930166 RepID=UPI0009B67B1F|nr:cupin domain-containing protein [Pseudomonas brassicacearum]
MNNAIIRISTQQGLSRWPDFEASVAIRNNPAHAGSVVFETATTGIATIRTGVWQCEPCILKVDQTTNEICLLIEGKASIADDITGHTETFQAGDGFVLRKNSKITWSIDEPLKKYYITIED